MTAQTKANILGFITENFNEVTDLLIKTVVRDSNFKTLVYWDGSEVRAEHRTGSLSDLPHKEDDEFHIGYLTIDTPDEISLIEESLNEMVNQSGVDTSNAPILEKIIKTGINVLAHNLVEDGCDDPEGIREAAATNWDASNRKSLCEEFLDGVIASLKTGIQNHLELYRQALNEENISYGELVDLAALSDYISEGDVQLLEAAGRAEFEGPDEDPNYSEDAEHMGGCPR
jgi:hypothetical protein